MKRMPLIVLALAALVVTGMLLYGRFTDRVPERSPVKDTTLIQLEQFIEESPHQISLAYYDFADQRMQDINGNREIFPASMIKVLFLLAALEEVEAGELSLAQTYTLTEEDKYMNGTPVTGSGTIQNEEPGKEFTIEEILHLMVSISDNIAANITVDLVGRDKIESLVERLQLTHTSAVQKMFEAPDGVPRNMSTARELTEVLVALEKATVVNEELSEKGTEMMKDTIDKSRIGRKLNQQTITVANKVGTASSMVGDMGLLYFAKRAPVALTIMIVDPESQELADEEIGQLTKMIVDAVTE
ncbi:MAG: class A beta-lactamase-related serine hydrolase [Firmicutes bacterium]|nr:class A beta-lactamase-related serine hydrolase [Bacillota bacterium]